MPRYCVIRREWSRQDFEQDVEATNVEEAVLTAYELPDAWVATSDLQTVRTELITAHEVPGS